jgi:hypothetical protein
MAIETVDRTESPTRSTARPSGPTPFPPAARRSTAVATVPVPSLLIREQCIQRVETALQAKMLSGVVAQVIAQAASPRTDTNQLLPLVSRDPLSSARVLRTSNSASDTRAGGSIATLSDSKVRAIAATLEKGDARVGPGRLRSNSLLAAVVRRGSDLRAASGNRRRGGETAWPIS